jgi:hypothetical protein
MSNGVPLAWAVDGPPPIPPVHGLVPAAEVEAAGVRVVVDTAMGPVDALTVDEDGSLESGLYRKPDGSIWMRQAGGDAQVYTPANAGRERWMNGIQLWPYPPETPLGWDGCGHIGSDGEDEKSFGENVEPPSYRALTIVQPITCTTQSVPDENAFKARAVATLTAVQSYAIARELMSGETLGQPYGLPYLADTHCQFPNGQAATRPNHGLQVLEQAIAETGRLGLIHCSPMLATALLGQGFVIKDKSGVIRTINGIPVIPDFGYVGVSKPDNGVEPDVTEEWAYASGPVDLRWSEILTTPDTLVQAVDRSLGATNGRPNTITYRAERYTVASWDTALQAAVLIDRCGTDCVSSS